MALSKMVAEVWRWRVIFKFFLIARWFMGIMSQFYKRKRDTEVDRGKNLYYE